MMNFTVFIRNLGRTIELRDSTRPLLYHIHASGIDWMHACGGKGRCTTCKAIVLNGISNLSPPSAAEQRYRQKNLLADNERLACQTFVTGNIEIYVPAESKLPHLDYLDT